MNIAETMSMIDGNKIKAQNVENLLVAITEISEETQHCNLKKAIATIHYHNVMPIEFKAFLIEALTGETTFFDE